MAPDHVLSWGPDERPTSAYLRAAEDDPNAVFVYVQLDREQRTLVHVEVFATCPRFDWTAGDEPASAYAEHDVVGEVYVANVNGGDSVRIEHEYRR